MIRLIKSTFHNEKETKERLIAFLRSAETLSMGEETRKFEQAFAKKQERAFAVMVNSGSSANLVLIQSLLNLGHLRKGDVVGFSALTWSTNVMPLIQLGLVPVAIDCEIDTLNVSPRTLLPYLGSIKALFITNALGFCDDLPKITELCEDNRILLLEDNCESLGSSIQGKFLGNYGYAATFSFYVGHHLSTIEGGMVCTDDLALRDMLALVRAHGWARDVTAQTQHTFVQRNGTNGFYDRYTFYDLGYNLRPIEINAFIGNQQLQYWDDIVGKRELNFRKFERVMSKNKDLARIRTDHMDTVSNFAVPVICRDKAALEYYLACFEKAEIETRPIIGGDITKQPFYRKYISDAKKASNAQTIHEQGFYFANNPELIDADIDYISTQLTTMAGSSSGEVT